MIMSAVLPLYVTVTFVLFVVSAVFNAGSNVNCPAVSALYSATSFTSPLSYLTPTLSPVGSNFSPSV